MIKLKSAEKSLRESDERYRLLFETSRDAIMTLDPPAWNFTSGNAAAFELFDVKNEETFISAPPWKYSPEFQPDGQSSENKAKKMIGIAMEKGSNFFEWTHKKQNGEDFFATVLLTRISIGEKTFLQATVRDITERKKAEEKLRESEEKYRALIETTSTGFVIIDGKGIVVDANSEYVRLTGQQTLKNILGKCVVEWTAEHDKKKNAEEVKKCFEQGITRNLEIDYVDKSGKFTPIEINATVVGTMRGSLIVVTLCQDITRRKRVEKELKKYREHLKDMVENRTAELKSEISKRKQAEKELQAQKSALEQKNIALSEIIAQIEVEKKKMKDDIAANVNELVFPILEKLKLKNADDKYVDLLKNHLEKLVSSFGRKIRGKRLNLTSREIEICNMIKGSLASKEISDLLNISLQTVEKHRKNIRRKMGIRKKDINLASFLQTI